MKQFDGYEIHGVIQIEEDNGTFYYEMVTDDSKPDLWSLYGHIDGEGVECIGDYKSVEDAERIYSLITGKKYEGII